MSVKSFSKTDAYPVLSHRRGHSPLSLDRLEWPTRGVGLASVHGHGNYRRLVY